MRVIRFDSKLPVKFTSPRVRDRVPEGVQLLAGIALSLWGPPLLYSAIVNNTLPFFVMLCNEALGILFGLFLFYRKNPGDYLSCVPAGYAPKNARAERVSKKRAA